MSQNESLKVNCENMVNLLNIGLYTMYVVVRGHLASFNLKIKNFVAL